jgi:DNA-directed RNA polymerase
VANVVIKMVERDAMLRGEEEHTQDAVSLGWLGKVNRKVCKRPVMTLAYGAKRFGFRDQVFVDTDQAVEADKSQPFPFEGDGFAAASYMGGLIWDACWRGGRGSQVQQWTGCRGARVVIAKKQQPMIWKTPVGFVAAQQYALSDTMRLGADVRRVNIAGEPRQGEGGQAGLAQAGQRDCAQRHPLDGRLAPDDDSERSGNQGDKAFSLIHDSFGCHAGYAGTRWLGSA